MVKKSFLYLLLIFYFSTFFKNDKLYCYQINDNSFYKIVLKAFNSIKNNEFIMYALKSSFLTVLSATTVFFVFMALQKLFDKKGLRNFKTIESSKFEIILPGQSKIPLDNVILGDIKNEIKDMLNFLKNPAAFIEIGAEMPKGFLFSGLPGTGKTFLAKAIASEAGCPFIFISSSTLIEYYIGSGVSTIRNLFDKARILAENSPVIIFFDEIDAVASKRFRVDDGNNERAVTLNELLTQMDGIKTSKFPIIIIGATNKIDVLDESILRSGRFDKILNFNLPTLELRVKLADLYLNKVNRDKDVDPNYIAQKTAGFSAADIKNLINSSAILAARKGLGSIGLAEINCVLEKLIYVKNKNYEKDKVFDIILPGDFKITLNDVILDYIDEDIKDIINFAKQSKDYANIGAEMPKGFLFVGPPGVGKTFLAKAISSEANCPFLSACGTSFVSKYIGEGAKNVRNLFDTARKLAEESMVIIFLDEIDSIASQRSNSSFMGERETILNELLFQMDGMKTSKFPIIVIGATNRKDVLDEAILRPGRFDRILNFDLPVFESRIKLANLYLSKIKHDKEVDGAYIAVITSGFSGADIKNLINLAAILTIKNGKESVGLIEIEETIDELMLGKYNKKVNRTYSHLSRTAIHEAGHAISNIFMFELFDKVSPIGYCTPLYKISIKSRGNRGGINLFRNKDDGFERFSKEYYIADIILSLSGGVAEEIIFGANSFGNANDLESANKSAGIIVSHFGIIPELRDVTFDGYYKYGIQLPKELADKLEIERQKIIKDCREKAYNLLTNHIKELKILAAELLKKDSNGEFVDISASQVYAMFNLEMPKSTIDILAEEKLNDPYSKTPPFMADSVVSA